MEAGIVVACVPTAFALLAVLRRVFPAIARH